MINTHSINIDSTNACTLRCSKCERQQKDGWRDFRKNTKNLNFVDFKKIANFFKDLSFCGTYGDPIFNVNFIDFLEYSYSNGNIVSISTAAHHRPKEWYEEAFKANPNARWVFGIDGLPKDSHKYRIGQDGEYLFEIMLLAHKMGINVKWQYIIFKYNENDLDTARKLAQDNNIEIEFIKSNRWSEDDPLKPSEDFINKNKNFRTEDYLEPKCFKGTRIGHTCQGYLLPCCWMARNNVEELYPELCNESTKISNVNSIQEIFDSQGWKNLYSNLENNQEKAYPICWKICKGFTKVEDNRIK